MNNLFDKIMLNYYYPAILLKKMRIFTLEFTLDAESDSRRLYALRLRRFNAPQRHISAITAYIYK